MTFPRIQSGFLVTYYACKVVLGHTGGGGGGGWSCSAMLEECVDQA